MVDGSGSGTGIKYSTTHTRKRQVVVHRFLLITFVPVIKAPLMSILSTSTVVLMGEFSPSSAQALLFLSNKPMKRCCCRQPVGKVPRPCNWEHDSTVHDSTQTRFAV